MIAVCHSVVKVATLYTHTYTHINNNVFIQNSRSAHHRDSHTSVFMAALLTTDQSWNNLSGLQWENAKIKCDNI